MCLERRPCPPPCSPPTSPRSIHPSEPLEQQLPCRWGGWSEMEVGRTLGRDQGPLHRCPAFHPSRLPVLVSWGFCNKWPQAGWLKTTGMCPPTVAEARSLKSRRQREGRRWPRGSREPFYLFQLLVARGVLHVCLSSHGRLPCMSGSSPLSYKDTCHGIETLSPGCSPPHLDTLNYTCKDLFSKRGHIDKCQAWTQLSGAGHKSPHLAVPFGRPLWDLNLPEVEDQHRVMGKEGWTRAGLWQSRWLACK